MTDDITKDLTDSEKLNLLLAQMTAFQAWQAKVDAFIDDRSRDTKPLLGQILKEITDTRAEMQEGFERIEARLSTVEEESKRTRREVGMLREDMRNERLARVELMERIEDLERRPS